MSAIPPVPSLEHFFDVSVRVAPPADLGVTRAGARRVISILGGTVTGRIPRGDSKPTDPTEAAGAAEALEAEILPGGADRQVIRSDGTIEIDAQYTARTEQGELLILRTRGIRAGSPEVLARLAAGAPVDPTEYYFRTDLTVETASPRLAHLERACFVASCLRAGGEVRFGVYRVL